MTPQRKVMELIPDQQRRALKVILGRLNALRQSDPAFDAKLYQIRRLVATELGRLDGKLQVRHTDLEDYSHDTSAK